jgi:hypothetical protein
VGCRPTSRHGRPAAFGRAHRADGEPCFKSALGQKILCSIEQLLQLMTCSKRAESALNTADHESIQSCRRGRLLRNHRADIIHTTDNDKTCFKKYVITSNAGSHLRQTALHLPVLPGTMAPVPKCAQNLPYAPKKRNAARYIRLLVSQLCKTNTKRLLAHQSTSHAGPKSLLLSADASRLPRGMP